MTSVTSRKRPGAESRIRSVPSPAGLAGIALLPIGADLLPQKAVTGRGGRGRRLLALGIVVVAVVALAGAYLFSLHARSTADAALATAQDQQRSLQTQQRSFDELIRTQAQDTQLRQALTTLMKTDTSWSAMLTGIASVDTGIAFTSIDASLADPTAAVQTGGAPTTPGEVGTLTMSGAAADKPTIAAFVDALGGITGLADPFLSSVNATADTSASAGGYTFSVTVSLTGDLQSTAAGRWAPTTGGGK